MCSVDPYMIGWVVKHFPCWFLMLYISEKVTMLQYFDNDSNCFRTYIHQVIVVFLTKTYRNNKSRYNSWNISFTLFTWNMLDIILSSSILNLLPIQQYMISFEYEYYLFAEQESIKNQSMWDILFHLRNSVLIMKFPT